MEWLFVSNGSISIGAIKSSSWTLDPPQCELGSLATHRYHRIKSLFHVRLFLKLNLLAMYLEHFTSLKLNYCISTLVAKPSPSDHTAIGALLCYESKVSITIFFI